jgi:signal transduction histidine kinase
VSRFLPAGFFARVTVVLTVVTLVAVAFAVLASSRLVRVEVRAVQGVHARDDAREVAAAAASYLRSEGKLTPRALEMMSKAVAAGDGELTVLGPDGELLIGPPARDPKTENDLVAAPVIVGGSRLGTAIVHSTLSGPDGLNATLRDRLNRAVVRVNVMLVFVAFAGALGLAMIVSAGLTRPLRELTIALRHAERTGSREPIEVPHATAGIKALAGAYNRLLATLRRQESKRQEAAASIAHELRTPISGVVSRLEGMEDGILPLDVDNVRAVLHEAERLRRLVEDVDRLHDAEQPLRPLRHERLALDLLVARRLASFIDGFVRRGIAVRGDFAPAWIDGDDTRLEQVVDNLLSNALRYTDDGGRVAVTVRAGGGQAAIVVADDGMGIDADDLPHVFEPFWRAERSRARATGGAGLGLAVARELVEGHDGTITMRSWRGCGTVAEVLLPAAAEPERRSRAGHQADTRAAVGRA